jgi:hypothetical protein
MGSGLGFLFSVRLGSDLLGEDIDSSLVPFEIGKSRSEYLMC